MSSKEQECERRVTFYTSREVVSHLAKNGVPKSRRATKALIAVGTTGSINGEVTQGMIDCLSYVNFEVHPQQINIRDLSDATFFA